MTEPETAVAHLERLEARIMRLEECIGHQTSFGFVTEINNHLIERIDSGHGRIRESLDELRTELREAAADLLVLQTERDAEKEFAKMRKQDVRDRTVLLTAFTSTIVTVGILAIKAALNL